MPPRDPAANTGWYYWGFSVKETRREALWWKYIAGGLHKVIRCSRGWQYSFFQQNLLCAITSQGCNQKEMRIIAMVEMHHDRKYKRMNLILSLWENDKKKYLKTKWSQIGHIVTSSRALSHITWSSSAILAHLWTHGCGIDSWVNNSVWLEALK